MTDHLMQNGPDSNTRLPGTYDPAEQYAQPAPDPATQDKMVQPFLPDSGERDTDADPVLAMLYQGDAHANRTVSRIRSEAPGNADKDDRPHFLRNVGGEEVCGQDGKPWPCAEWSRMTADDTPVGSAVDETLLTREQAAAALGLTVQEVDAALAARQQDAPPLLSPGRNYE